MNFWIKTSQTSRADFDKREGSSNPNQFGIIIVFNHPGYDDFHQFRIGSEIINWSFDLNNNVWHNVCLMFK